MLVLIGLAILYVVLMPLWRRTRDKTMPSTFWHDQAQSDLEFYRNSRSAPTQRGAILTDPDLQHSSTPAISVVPPAIHPSEDPRYEREEVVALGDLLRNV